MEIQNWMIVFNIHYKVLEDDHVIWIDERIVSGYLQVDLPAR